MKITKKTLLAEIIEKHPGVAEALVFKYGLHCVGCPAAAMETLEEGLKAHGMSDEEVEKVIDKLNSLTDKGKSKGRK